MGTGSSCPHCGCGLDDAGNPASPPDAVTVDRLLVEVEELRATVARLRGSGFTALIPPASAARVREHR